MAWPDVPSPRVLEAQLALEVLDWPERARALQVTDADSYQAAAELLLGIKDLRARIADTFDPHIRRALEAHRALLKEKAAADAPLTDAERIIKDALGLFDREQARLQALEQARQEEAARQAEADRLLAQAAAMEREGLEQGDQALVEEAEALIEQPVRTPPIAAVPRGTPAVAGISYRTTWSHRIVNFKALIRYVADHPEHTNLLLANTQALNALARALKADLAIPGVQAVETRDVAAGRR